MILTLAKTIAAASNSCNAPRMRISMGKRRRYYDIIRADQWRFSKFTASVTAYRLSDLSEIGTTTAAPSVV